MTHHLKLPIIPFHMQTLNQLFTAQKDSNNSHKYQPNEATA